MSLLILNASNRIAQGFIYNAVNSQQYEKIILADPFPETSNIERLLKFKKTLPQSNIELIKLYDRQDIHDAVKQANHLLFVAHDYHKLTSAKSNQLQAALDYVKTRNYKVAAYVEPIEHQYVKEPKSLKEVADQARKSLPNLVGIKSDFTFGPFSTFQDILAYKIQKGHLQVQEIQTQPLVPQQKQPKELLNPISSVDLGNLVNQVLKGQHSGKSFYVEGKQQITFKEYYLAVSKKLAQPKSQQNNNFKFLSGAFSKYFYDQAYNAFSVPIDNHEAADKAGYEGLPFEPTVDFQHYFNDLALVELEEHGPYTLRQFG